jgi:hypothetical protein
MANMSQLAMITAPTKSPKQYAPKRIIIFGSARIVMPKTTDVKSENRSTALKWLSIIYEAFRPLASECASTAAM